LLAKTNNKLTKPTKFCFIEPVSFIRFIR
jgi:hypothetical protein